VVYESIKDVQEGDKAGFSEAAVDELAVGGGDDKVSSDEDDDAPPCEVVKKTKAEYDATLAKLGVAKVCEKKYRPTGSEEPFTLCETTTGVSKNSTCRTCQTERQGKPARGSRACAARHLPRPEGARPCRNNAGVAAIGKYNGVEMFNGLCCNGACANAIAKALYQKEYEGIDYPEGFRPPSSTSAPSAAAKQTT